MPVSLDRLVSDIVPERTLLLFGAGASVTSGAPSVSSLIENLSKSFHIDAAGYSLSELCGIIEERRSRRQLIAALRESFKSVSPTGGLLMLPRYSWKSIFSTNYDKLVEYCYERVSAELNVYASNFYFTLHDSPISTKLFKLHGTIDKDTSDGVSSRIIITEADYDATEEYREVLYTRLKNDMAGAHLIIIGHSLADPDIRDIVNKAAQLNTKSGAGGQITLLMYQQDENRALLQEKRGISVCFSGIDEFFHKISASNAAPKKVVVSSSDPLDQASSLQAITIAVSHSCSAIASDVSSMFSGWPASYADIAAGTTFGRKVSEEVYDYLFTGVKLFSMILGAAGVGKTTICRQVLYKLHQDGYHCWEHKSDSPFLAQEWLKVASYLHKNNLDGIIFIDDAHSHLQQINELSDRLISTKVTNLRIIISSTRNHWHPRIKTPNIYKYGIEHIISQLKSEEIDRLLLLVQTNSAINALVEPSFSGFSRQERRRRLIERCEADMFVCLKNIFASERFDDIILREFASIDFDNQEIYRYVAAMEHAGVRVHRQLVIRLLNIPAQTVSAALDQLTDIITEYTVTEKEGIYGWKCRHSVIAGIISKFKFNDLDKIIDLFEKIIDEISPTYEIEIRTIREMCNVDTGLPRIPDKEIQNRLLRKMMSRAPGERVPRHRLIRNLISMGQFEKAETEIRIFNKDFGSDGPVYRYKVNLMVARATKSPGIMKQDRVTILEEAYQLATVGVERYAFNKNMLSAFAELGIDYYRMTGSYSYFDQAMKKLKTAEEGLGDPEISKLVIRYERRIAGHSFDEDNDDLPDA